MTKIYWMQPGKIDSVSGGYIYNKNIVDGIRTQSLNLELHNPGTDFPFPAKKSLDNCRAFFQNLKNSSIVIIDSLIMGIIPDLIKEFAAKHIIAGMIHLPLSLCPSFTDDVKKNFKQNEIKSFKYSKILIVTSEYLKSEIMMMGIDKTKIHVLTPGIDTVMSKRNYPGKPKNLLCVSRISRSKGQLDLILALENLQYLDWNLTLCGGYDEHDDYYKEIRDAISILGLENKIVFTGERSGEEVATLYKRADLFVLTSYFETYSMVIQEAMAFQLPLIAANSGAVTQTADSKVAKFYQPGDIAELEKYLIELLTNKDEYKTLVNGYNQLDFKFISWTKKAKQFLNILEEYNGN